MKRVVCVHTYAIPAEILWHFLRDFYADWHPAMAWCKREADGVRCFAGVDDGTIYREQLTVFDDEARRYQYVALEGIDEVESYTGSLQVIAQGDRCEVVYAADIRAQQPRLNEVAAGTEMIFNMGLDALETIVEQL